MWQCLHIHFEEMPGSVSSQIGESRSRESKCGIESMTAGLSIPSRKICSVVSGAIPFVGLDFHTKKQFFPLAMAMDIDSAVTEQAVLDCIRARRVSPRVLGFQVEGQLVRRALPILGAAEASRKKAARALRKMKSHV